jgi:hypothetical protein
VTALAKETILCIASPREYHSIGQRFPAWIEGDSMGLEPLGLAVLHMADPEGTDQER